ncbi:proteolipid protein 2-like [Oreochromis aureus]|uniref:Proteolipid protein 2 n=1 Tax=Oreochromis aureus TaxID=47969 RepID=A0AAZ1Y0H8_OREAU|nr:proteolipid protein 2-like [Oreochromis aureus]
MADTTASGSPSCVERLKSYMKTQKGFILAAEILVSFIIIICYDSSWCGGFTTLPICKMTFATIFFIIFMMDLDKQILVINWVWTDLFRAAVGAIFYIITSLINLTIGSRDGACMAGAVLGLFAGLIFAYDTYTIYLQIQSTRQHPAAPTDDRV